MHARALSTLDPASGPRGQGQSGVVEGVGERPPQLNRLAFARWALGIRLLAWAGHHTAGLCLAGISAAYIPSSSVSEVGSAYAKCRLLALAGLGGDHADVMIPSGPALSLVLLERLARGLPSSTFGEGRPIIF